jgi:hypothetical protein
MDDKDEKYQDDAIEKKIDFITESNSYSESYLDLNDNNEQPDDSGKQLDNYYSYYDIVNTCWKEMSNFIKLESVPICEYMTIYNFHNFIENF